jgi:hypothetical protein
MSYPEIQELVKKPGWQKVREKLVGQWKEKPTWCCSELRKYLGNIKTTHYDNLRIVMNYLVGSGFRMGKIKHSCITKLREELSKEFKRRHKGE